MRKFNSKGSLLFETLIALLVLAVGVTASLRLFGQALYASTRNFDQMRARRLMDERLFPVFAGAGEWSMDSKEAQLNLETSYERPLKLEFLLEPLAAAAEGAAEQNSFNRNQYSVLKLSAANSQGMPLYDAETVVTQVSGPR